MCTATGARPRSAVLTSPPRPPSTLFPYTTLFRSPYALDRSAGGSSGGAAAALATGMLALDRKSTRLNSSHVAISYAVFCLKKKTDELPPGTQREPRTPPQSEPPIEIGSAAVCSAV